MNEKKIKIMITSVGGGGTGMEIMKSLRQSTNKYYLIGTDMSEQSFGLFKADKGLLVPPARDPCFIDSVIKMCKREKVWVLFPGSEIELKIISDNRDSFKENDIYLPINTKEVIDLCLDKKRTFDFLKSKNVSIPKTVAIDTEADISDVDFYPSIIKPYLGTGGSKNVFIAQDSSELYFFCKYLLKYGNKPLVQEYVGSYENEYTVGILSGHDGKIISTVALKRQILSGLSNKLKAPSLNAKGMALAVSSGISQGKIVDDKGLIEGCNEIAKKVGSRGPLNIQCRYVEGVIYPFEINPRISGTTNMRALAGVNESDLLIRKYVLKEQLPEKIEPRTGLAIRGLEEMFQGD
ncbi:MAG: ATP-grasp domain-containing protein [Euryarchaeota archaeon]|nr:ATP-grasp domain-containing protein [Euryarchaeota archaeon]MBU4032167.1 ATP-grasp domain-containing protein [Candidatus Thermoplasmatota archaeon]MBU4072303.1 ATP-grasp domain-containing protein [Candidatus Thermoplasmatota archaeon]MBU4143849.1 ATP-grasp domain-containing protein [Candidatus Thermoplasmatota archaeon]